MTGPLKEYYNLYVEYDNSSVSFQEEFDTVSYTLLTKNEIYKYIDYIKVGKWGYQPIGTRKLMVVQPHKIQIFDLSIIVKDDKEQDFGKLEQVVQLKSGKNVPILQQLREFGKDVTPIFNIDLSEILIKEQPPVSTKETATTTTTIIEEEKKNANAITFDGEPVTFDEEPIGVDFNSENPELIVEVYPIFPNEFSDGIIDNSNNPAFNVEKVAKVFASHIKNLKDESGQMVGVFGKWGRGKSYFIEKVFDQFKSETSEPFIKVKFQAWKYQNTTSVWAYLYETFIEEYLRVEWYNKWFRIFCLSIKRNGHWKAWIRPLILIFAGLLAIKFTPAFKDADVFEITIKLAGIAGTLAVAINKISSIVSKIKKPAISIFDSITKIPSFKSALGIQAEIQKELKSLIEAWSNYLGKKRILLFVDDLDRCSESQIIEIIDSLRVILDDKEITKSMLILVALDEDKLKRAIKTKYKELFKYEEDKLQAIVDEYMDKLFISAIKLYPISFDERAEFVEKLAKQINFEDNVEEVVEKEKEQLPTPTQTSIPETNSDAEPERSPDSIQGTTTKSAASPEPTPASEAQKRSKNLEETEVTILQSKIKLANKELTPRQIRILIYRYLLARNLWRIFYEGLDFKSENAVDEIMRFSGYSNEDSTAETKVYPGLSNVVRMVVAY
jgi:Cdc6-like AAA superfamily ATPase